MGKTLDLRNRSSRRREMAQELWRDAKRTYANEAKSLGRMAVREAGSFFGLSSGKPRRNKHRCGC